MKKTTTTADADSGSAVSYDRLNKSALPRISYNRAMASYFIVPRSGAIRSVECASAEEFTALVKSCVLPARNQRARQLLKSAIGGLNFAEPLDKWYCVCELLAAGGIMNLYATPEQARAASTQKERLEVSR